MIAYQTFILVTLGIVLIVGTFIMYRLTIGADPKHPTETPAEIRGVSDEDLKFIHTTNLMLVAIARLMEAQGVEDEPLIRELYKRGRSSIPKSK